MDETQANMTPAQAGQGPDDPVRAHWTADPRRDDLPGDSVLWEELLQRAYDVDGPEPDGLFGALHGLRCCGALLVRNRSGVRLVGSHLGDDYPGLRERYLKPRAQLVRTLLAELELTQRPLLSPTSHLNRPTAA